MLYNRDMGLDRRTSFERRERELKAAADQIIRTRGPLGPSDEIDLVEGENGAYDLVSVGPSQGGDRMRTLIGTAPDRDQAEGIRRILLVKAQPPELVDESDDGPAEGPDDEEGSQG